MGQCQLGLSGGVEVTGQQNGVTLYQAGDFAVIQISNSAPPGGPDLSGIFALSGIPASCVIIPEFVLSLAQYGSDPVGVGGNWQFLQGTIRNDTNNYITGQFTPPVGALQINPGAVSGLFAVRIRLVSGSGSILVAGNTNPAGVASLDALILSQITAQASLMKAQLLALSDMNGVDYAGAYGIQW